MYFAVNVENASVRQGCVHAKARDTYFREHKLSRPGATF